MRKLIIPGIWLKLKVAWWRLKRKFSRPRRDIAWCADMRFCVVDNAWDRRIVVGDPQPAQIQWSTQQNPDKW